MQIMKKLVILHCLTLLLFASVPVAAQDSFTFTRTQDVVYGRKFGVALTLDVFQPAQGNGAGVILIVSGGWFSSHDGINTAFARPFLDRGYTVFAVVHGSQPKFIVTEIEQDI